MRFDDVPFTRSVSEYNRQMEELMESRNRAEPYGIKTYHQACERIRQLRADVNNIKWSKSVRQPLFAELRELEAFWGIESIGYNREGCGVSAR